MDIGDVPNGGTPADADTWAFTDLDAGGPGVPGTRKRTTAQMRSDIAGAAQADATQALTDAATAQAAIDAHDGTGGTTHPDAIASGASGFMSGADKAKVNGIEAAADVTDAENVAAAGALMDTDFAGSAIGLLTRTGAGAYAVIRHHLTATAAPGGSDNFAAGWSVGSLWWDVTGGKVYGCTGDGVWQDLNASGGAALPTIDKITGFVADAGTAANRRGYTHGTDPLGSGNVVLVALSRLINSSFVSGGARQIFGSWDGAGGMGIVQDGGTIGYRYVDGSATLRSGDNFLPNRVAKFGVYHMRVINGGGGSDLTIQLYENGAQILEGYFAGAGGAPTAGGNLCVGVKDEGAVTPSFENGEVHGCAYVNADMTPAAIAAHAEAIQEAGQLVDSAGGLTDGWRVDDGASVPTGSTWASFLGGTALSALNAIALTRSVKASPIVWA